MTNAIVQVHQYAIIVDSDNRVLWIKSAKSKKLMFPGGTVEKGESLDVAFNRELVEEIGFKAKVQGTVNVQILDFYDPPHLEFYFLCTAPKGKIRLSHEHSSYEWKAIKETKNSEVAHPSLIGFAKKAISMRK